MRILHTCLSKSWGGMEMLTLNSVLGLSGRNIQTDLLCIENSRLHREAMKKGIKIITSRYSGHADLREIFRLKNIFTVSNYDIIHAEASKDLWLLVPALRLGKLRTPLLLTKHVGSFIIKKDIFHKWLYKRLNYAIAISTVIKKNLADTTPLSDKNILLIHNGVDTVKFNPESGNGQKIRTEFSMGKDQIAIGMMARFSPGKGHEEFLKAAQELLSGNPGLLFMIIGEPSKGEDQYAVQIKSLADELGIRKKVIFTGFRSDTPDVLAALDIFVFPSHAEAFGLALAEAMSMGKPSVCSNSDGVLDIAVDGETSFLFQNKDWLDLKNKISRLIDSEELRFKFGTAARERILQNFSEQKYLDRLTALYESLIS